MRKLLTTLIIGITVIGAVSAQSADIPKPGITPDSPLYMFEKLSERLAIGVAKNPVLGSEELEAKVRANQAAERLSEAKAMANKNKSQHVEKLMQQYSENMNKSVDMISRSNNSELKNKLRNISNNQVKTLEEVEKKVPEQAKKGIQKAIENSQRNQKALRNRPDNRGVGEAPRSTPNTERPQNLQPQEAEGSQQNQNRVTGKATEPSTGKKKSDQSTEDSSHYTENRGRQDTENTFSSQKNSKSDNSRNSRP